jgi:hypothetical protein
MAVFFVVVPCSLVEVYHFRGIFLHCQGDEKAVREESCWGKGTSQSLTDWCLHLNMIPHAWLTHRPDDGGSKYLWNGGKFLPDYMALQPRRHPSSHSLLWEPQVLLNCKQIFRHELFLACILFYTYFMVPITQCTEVWINARYLK